ncbi:MAG: protein kinase [Kofleriaceae bacterium]
MTVHELLATLAVRPAATWRSELETAYPHDPCLVQQALLWLHASGRIAERTVDPRYELVTRLDGGATAEVWRAYDRRLARTVAIKVFHDPANRVLAEARAASEVISDHVVRIHDVQPGFIVMELVAEYDGTGSLVLGGSAATCRPRSTQEAATWILQIARGVHDAHARNVFHRDLNPRNVLVTPITRRARIADFGLATSTHAEGSASGGTPEYIAPELARAALLGRRDLERADLVAVDVWGIGAIAYELVVGRAPWAARDGGDSWELAAVGDELELSAIPKRLRRIVAKMLAIDPMERYENAQVVVDELVAYLASKPTSRDRARTIRIGLWARRNPQLLLTAFATSTLVVLVIAGIRILDRLEEDRTTLAGELAERRAERDRTRAEVVVTERRLAERNAELAVVEHSLAEERETYATVLHTKDLALRQATSETRFLLGQLDVVRDDRQLAEASRGLFERFWTSARADADRATRERVRVQAERDVLRQERDELRSELERIREELARITATLPEPVTTEPAAIRTE